MNASPSTPRYPKLPEPYHSALLAAVAYALEHFDVSALLLAGTVLRGAPDQHSDLDIYVLHHGTTRQRIQKFFNEVPVELFVNPPARIRRYFEQENPSGRPMTAHMFAGGFPILDRDGVLAPLVESAKAWLDKAPAYPPQHAVFERYFAATLFEDALDIYETNPAGALLILGLAVPRMLSYVFIKEKLNQPRHKDLLESVAQLDPELAGLVGRFYASGTPDERLAAAGAIADRTIRTRGFFEWESQPEEVGSA